MTTRIAHLSDLHFPASDAVQARALQAALAALRPDLVVVSGDLTRAGRRSEFAAAAAFFAGVAAPKLMVPGNHDVPVFNPWQRVFAPYDRFRWTMAQGRNPVWRNGEAAVTGFNTAYGLRASADWSLGWAKRARVTRTVEALCDARDAAVRIVACHHPLLRDTRDPYRSTTLRGAEAFAALARAGMTMHLHGHLHRAGSRVVDCEGRMVTVAGATAALGDRERGDGSGFNLIEVSGGRAAVIPWRWDGAFYSA